MSPLFLSVRIPPRWEQIEPLRRYVDECMKGAGESVAGRASMVLQELLENAVKYGDLTAQITVELDIQGSGKLEIRVRNRAQPARIAVLEKEFHRAVVGGGADAQQAFARALDRLRRLPQGASMLGLPRIAMEAQLRLEVEGDYALLIARVE
ncbi:MAG TPA: ATP-binding protein [Polyangiales bacterium]|nr:ATP-binding protein [Polyangiales bacterium]